MTSLLDVGTLCFFLRDSELELAFVAERRAEEADRSFRRARARSLLRRALRRGIGEPGPSRNPARAIVGYVDEGGAHHECLPVLKRSMAAAWRIAYLREPEEGGLALSAGLRGYYLEGGGAALIRLCLLEERGSLAQAFASALPDTAIGCALPAVIPAPAEERREERCLAC